MGACGRGRDTPKMEKLEIKLYRVSSEVLSERREEKQKKQKQRERKKENKIKEIPKLFFFFIFIFIYLFYFLFHYYSVFHSTTNLQATQTYQKITHKKQEVYIYINIYIHTELYSIFI